MNTARQRTVTITEVAEAAGVSIGTVSRFLNDLPVKDDNRERIAAAIDKLDYRRNALASAMKAARTGVIGILVPNLDGFHSALVERLVVDLRAQGLMSLTHCHDNSAESVSAALDFFRNYRVDALVMGGSPDHVQAIRDLVGLGTPVITYDNPQPRVALDGVEVDNAGAAEAATRHLIEAGHRHIGIITGPLLNQTAISRLEGWRRAMEAAGLPTAEHLMQDGGWKRVTGAEAMKRMLDQGPPPTAVFGSSYRMTIGAMNVLRERGLSIPQDVSLVSFDDVELFRLMTPAITVVAQPVEAMADALTARVAERTGRKRPGADDARRAVLPCELIVRDSVAAPREQREGGPADAGA